MKKAGLIGLCLLLCLCVSQPAVALSKRGSRGEEVTRIQQALKQRGYYTGAVDGVYGSGTQAAVTAFQRDNGLSADGIAGHQTLTALGLSAGNTDSDYQLLARVISAEARGEPYIGQVAVGAVILNRIEHPSFPDSLTGVIFQNGAFTCMTDGQFSVEIAESAYSAARDALNGLDPTGGAMYYYNPATATNQWIRNRPVVYTVGAHVFCQ